MFLDFLYLLRDQGVPVGTHEWIAFEEALALGLEGGRLDGFYHLGRSLLIKSEGHYDAYDVAFARYFHGFDVPLEVKDALLRWLDKPEGEQTQGTPTILQDAELMEEFKKLLETQNERHDGGSRYIGTRGLSPFGNQGQNPQGMRVGGQTAGGRSAIYQAENREFRNYRTDVKLETRQFKVALKGLRKFEKEGQPVLQLDPTIKRTADNGGEIDLVFGPDRKNSVKLLLLMDAGGSMDPYSEVVNRLFSAAFAAHHFKRFEYYYFHNCVYSRIYKDIAQRQSVPTQEMLRDLPQDFRVVFVGDACMAPWELTAANDIIGYGSTKASGLDWIRRIKGHFRGAVWLNPEPRSYWSHPTISQVGAVIPMFELTLDGMGRAMRRLRSGRRDLP